MKTTIQLITLVASLLAGAAIAQDKGPQSGSESAGHKGPPPQAYEDCKGKKAGDKVQHTTPDGKVSATCEESPQGLVARPDQRPGGKSGERPPRPEKDAKPRD